MSVNGLTSAVKTWALEAGFARAGIAPAGPVPRPDGLRQWLARGYHADMAYMARHLDKRMCPELLAAGAKSVICLAMSYAPDSSTAAGTGACGAAAASVRPFIARYARGRDYHKVLKKRCHALMDRLRAAEPAFGGRAFVDSGPIMERSLAAEAGLGWIGRNGCLIVPGLGSYVVLAEIVCNLPLAPDAPLAGRCGDCGACVRACPTGAIVQDGLVDCRRCLSYHTIENRGEIPPEFARALAGRIFGCDACQEACPHNRDAPPGELELTEQRQCCGATLEQIRSWRPEDWDAATAGSAVRRATYEMLLRNARLASK